MTKTTIFNFTNKGINFHKEQQLLVLERFKVTAEMYEHHHKNYMEDPTPLTERKALKAFEYMTHDLNNIKLHQQRETEERLQVANELIHSLCKELGKDVNELIESVSE